MSETETLAAMAHEFGLTDPSAAVLARTDIPARDAMAQLKREYPAAFRQPDPLFNAMRR